MSGCVVPGGAGLGPEGCWGDTDKSKRDYDAGSGGLGREVFAAWTQAKVIKRGSKVDYKLDYVALDYSATQVPVNSAGVPTLRPSSWKNFVRGIEKGVDRAYAVPTARQRTCPQEQIILAGYSQGAMVAHRLYWDLRTSKQTGIVNRIAGVVLIADGDRWPSDGVVHAGTASAKSRGCLGSSTSAERGPPG